MTESYFTCTYQ